MLGLLRGNRRGGPEIMNIAYNGETKQVNSYAPDLDRMSAKYNAPPAMVAKHQDRINNLDPDIRRLVALCVAVKVEDRPSIEHLLPEVERNARSKTPDDYRGYKYHANESNAAIRRLVEDHIFNATDFNDQDKILCSKLGNFTLHSSPTPTTSHKHIGF
jgi:hypothetical protein